MKHIPSLLFCCIIGGTFFQESTAFLEPICGVYPYRSRIYGGSQAGLSSAPWMAFLHDQSQFICGGSLITKVFVLTAAHCVIPTPEKLLVRLGENDWTSERDCMNGFHCAPPHEEYTVIRIYTHPKFISVPSHDIALLKLHKQVQYSPAIRPICILMIENMDNFYWFVDSVKTFTLTGWGATRYEPVSRTLQTVKLPQIDRGVCHDQYGYSVDHTNICAGDIHNFACTGDSGSPLGIMVSYGHRSVYTQIGIVSSGSEPCSGVAVFTNILSFTHWIKRTIAYDTKYMAPKNSNPLIKL
ncbi:chymotrypsin-like protease CTRL-1 [Drosophila eugracilis]|uniref:chymotrypsin-like protease CTRL-1 n=1 Tax=Drosophila eugracilis TaxID=29029 RepID=UPI0007E83F7E|nr:chymotrypsin-like protease CTRL-1 [Drosophila eugracilis]